MRILTMAQFYPPAMGGEERHSRELSIALAARGHDVTVATLAQPGLPEREIDNGVKIVRVSGLLQRQTALFSDAKRTHAPPFPDPLIARNLARIVNEARIEIVHAHNWLLHSFLPLKRAGGPGLIVTLHDLSLACATKNSIYNGSNCSGPGVSKCLSCAGRHYGTFKGAATTMGNWISGFAERRLVDRFLPVSQAVAMGNGLDRGPAPYEVVPNFIRDSVADAAAPPEYINKLPREPYLLFVGDLREFKGVHVLLTAYQRLASAPPLVLIGRRCPDTPTTLPENVHMFHDWPHAAVMHAWRNCLAGVLPSIGPEACATVIMEAMAMGKPVVASRIGGNPDIVEDSTSGILVAPGDPVALADALRKISSETELREALAKGASLRVQVFKASSVVPRIESIYRDVLSRRIQFAPKPHEAPISS